MTNGKKPRVLLIGCGNMGGAIARTMLAADPRPMAALAIHDPDEAKVDAVDGATFAADAAMATGEADIVLLAVKPQMMADATAAVAKEAGDRLFVSVAAGVTTAKLESQLPGGRVVRTMPNTPLLAGRGVVAMCRGGSATEEDLDLAASLFAGALVERLDESQMDAATAVSGSGPAYFFRFVEALAEAGVAAGLPADAAARLARETCIGAAALLDQQPELDPAELRRRVTSPGGTTAAALEAFGAGGLADLVDTAVAAAARRGKSLSR